jgi:hypothetical protein
MPKIFLSYSRYNVNLVQRIEQALKANDIVVWRDQEGIYGGEHWPKAIGEAISANDCLLLVWSKSSATSHFVEFEWNTAIALKKTILPCMLDGTPLPPALSAVNTIDLRVMESALPKILQALQKSVTVADPEHRAEVIAKLEEITSTEPETVVRDLNARRATGRAGSSVVASRRKMFVSKR